MQIQRWLLPWTHAVDLRAIDAVLQIAEHGAATLVVLSLVAPFQERREPSEQRPSRNASSYRLEQLQEAQDFLEAVRWKARQYQIAVEYHQVFTQDVPATIAAQCQELNCQSTILVRQGTQEMLLSAQSVRHVLMQPPAALLVLTLPAVRKDAWPVPRVLQRFFWWQQRNGMRSQAVHEETQVKRLVERAR